MFWEYYGLNGLGQAVTSTPILYESVKLPAAIKYVLAGGATAGLNYREYKQHEKK